MLRLHFLLGVAAPAALLALISQPLVQRSFEAAAGPLAPRAILAKGDFAKSDLAKGDLAARVPPGGRERAVHVPTVVEVVGIGPTRVILRTATGAVVYESDAVSNTTLVARDAVLPSVTVQAREGAPTAQQVPGASPATAPAPATGGPRPMPEGCEGAVSRLVGAEARRQLPSRCLAEAAPLRDLLGPAVTL